VFFLCPHQVSIFILLKLTDNESEGERAKLLDSDYDYIVALFLLSCIFNIEIDLTRAENNAFNLVVRQLILVLVCNDSLESEPLVKLLNIRVCIFSLHKLFAL